MVPKFNIFFVLPLLFNESLSFIVPHRSNYVSMRSSDESFFQVKMAGMGMGMAKSNNKKGGGSKNKKKNGATSGSSFDVSKAMLKSEKLYDELIKEATKVSDEDHKDFGSTITSEYVIAARLKASEMSSNIPGSSSISDWVPVAQLCLTRPVEADERDDISGVERERLSNAISYYCREISYAATLGSSLFKSIPRNLIQYSAEDVDSFYKYVYEDVIEGKNNDIKNENVMTKAEARKILQLDENNNDLAEIKQAYRKLSMKLHPDRFIGVERSKDEEEESNNQFAKVKLAYESLQSGIRVTNSGDKKVQSWYESLGGRARTDFIGSIDLISIEKAKDELSSKGFKCAVAGLNPETVMAFVTRNQMAS